MEPILLLHGALGAADQLAPLQIALEEMGCTVYRMNFSGHGSQAFEADFSMQQFASEIGRFLENQQIPRVHIFGYSMGGYAALYWAASHPAKVASIATLATKFDWTPEGAEREAQMLDPDKILEKVPQYGRMLQERHGADNWRLLLEKTAGMMRELGAQPLLDRAVLSKLELPVLVCRGTEDKMVSEAESQWAVDRLPNARFNALAGTRHPFEKVDLQQFTPLLYAHLQS
jgi:pimeloyl-ACP methyl ester carboxylesterase